MKNIYPHKVFQMHKVGVAIAAVFLIAGCSSTSSHGPIAQMATSRAAVISANTAGGNEFAPVPFKSATDKMSAAEQAMAKKDFVLAQRLAEQAQVDAQLATAAARSAKAQKAADAVHEDSNVLRQEINRKTK